MPENQQKLGEFSKETEMCFRQEMMQSIEQAEHALIMREFKIAAALFRKAARLAGELRETEKESQFNAKAEEIIRNKLDMEK